MPLKRSQLLYHPSVSLKLSSSTLHNYAYLHTCISRNNQIMYFCFLPSFFSFLSIFLSILLLFPYYSNIPVLSLSLLPPLSLSRIFSVNFLTISILSIVYFFTADSEKFCKWTKNITHGVRW